MQNTPPMVEAVESTLGDTQLCIVGFGNEADLDGALLSRLARDHPATGARRGMYTRANDGLALKKFFALCFGNIFESGTLIDPESTLLRDATTPAELPFDVCDEDQITLVVGWDVPGAPVEAALVSPAGAIVMSTTPGATQTRERPGDSCVSGFRCRESEREPGKCACGDARRGSSRSWAPTCGISSP